VLLFERQDLYFDEQKQARKLASVKPVEEGMAQSAKRNGERTVKREITLSLTPVYRTGRLSPREPGNSYFPLP